MTVFCSLFSDVASGESPILISDVLLTGSPRQTADGERYQRTYLPSIGGTFPDISNQATIVGVAQKMYITPFGGCFTFAGDFARAAKLHAALVEQHDIRRIVEICGDFIDDLQMAICTPETDGGINYVLASRSCTSLRPGPYGQVFIGGSGEASLRRLLLKQAQLPMHGDASLQPIASALCLVNEALQMDARQPSQTLGERFGAYYEIAAYTEGRYAKLDHVAHHYFLFVGDDTNGYWQLARSYFHEYLGNDLIVRTVAVGHEQGEPALFQECHVVGGLNAPIELDNATARTQCAGVSTHWEVVSLEIAGYTFRRVLRGRRLVEFRIDGGRWHFGIEPRLWAELMQETERTFST